MRRVSPVSVSVFQFTPLREGRQVVNRAVEASADFNSRPSARGDDRAAADVRRSVYFNSRPSARGDSARTPGRSREPISIHAPPRGATGAMARRTRPKPHFNSRPSARGDHRYYFVTDVMFISIHAPPRGATGKLRQLMIRTIYFNSRPSARGDIRRGSRGASWVISIHAPPRGATGVCGGHTIKAVFQFTPLREGRRFFLVLLLGGEISIHAPPRGATTHWVGVGYGESISIHAPPRGATVLASYWESLKEFQFTPLREGRQRGEAFPSPDDVISIHAPPRGATPRKFQLKKTQRISIHAPPRGATATLTPFRTRRRNFNSRPSARGDYARYVGIEPTDYFNSRPSARGDLPDGRLLVRWEISIHAPPRGATREPTT